MPEKANPAPYHKAMSCIRFNTTAQRQQLSGETRLAGDDPVAAFLSPAITTYKVERIRRLSTDANPKIRTNHGMQRSGGGLVSREINVNCRRPLIPVVRLT